MLLRFPNHDVSTLHFAVYQPRQKLTRLPRSGKTSTLKSTLSSSTPTFVNPRSETSFSTLSRPVRLEASTDPRKKNRKLIIVALSTFLQFLASRRRLTGHSSGSLTMLPFSENVSSLSPLSRVSSSLDLSLPSSGSRSVVSCLD